MKCIATVAIIAILVGALLMGPHPVRAQYIGGAYVKGANLPWLDGAYSDYLAIDPHHPDWGSYYNSAHMNQYLADMHNMGITVVRLWLFQDDQGCTIDGSGNVTGVTSQFWTNLDNTVALAGNNGIKLYLTLNNGRADFLTNSTMLTAFINNALKPMIKRYKGDSRIWAIDAMNEIDGVVAGSDGNYSTTGPTWAQAQSYMQTIASTVHSADSTRLVSCSTGWHSWYNLSYFKGQGLDFYDYHIYSDNGYIPPASSLGMDKPIYVGETGEATNSWNDSLQNTEMANILANSNSGYAGVGIWAYQYPGCTDIHSMLETNGSWRPVCNTIKNFVPGQGGTTPLANGTYRIVNRLSGLALDDYGWGTTNGATVCQWAYGGGANQQWTVTSLGNGQYEIVNVYANLALDAAGYGGSGTFVDLWSYGGGANQKWILMSAGGYYEILGAYNTNLALDDYGSSTANYDPSTNNGRIDVATWTGNANQQWSFQAP